MAVFYRITKVNHFETCNDGVFLFFEPLFVAYSFSYQLYVNPPNTIWSKESCLNELE